MTDTYTASEYRDNLRKDYARWSGKTVVVRDAEGTEIAAGRLIGLQHTRSRPGVADAVMYAFVDDSGAPATSSPVMWDRDQTVEVLPDQQH
ncbi:hypothetical protein UG54_00140 [Gordonia sihwensis]|nr:hypothetical protein UG54_00140 [Gordonia sihwensis]